MRTALAAVCAAALAGAFAPAGAHASTAVPGPPGPVCSSVGPLAEDSVVLTGGPVLGDGTLGCVVRTESGPVATASASGEGAVFVAPRTVTYTGEAAARLCTTFAVLGGPELYWDATELHWTTDADAPCDVVLLTDTPCVLQRCGSPPDPSVPPEPYYPRGTITISATTAGGVQYGFDDFDPPIAQWQCGLGNKTLSCTPPPPPEHFYYVCGTVKVTVTNQNLTEVAGDSTCAYGKVAHASARTPQSAAADADWANASLPWTCTAYADTLAILAWNVRCSVGPT